MGLSSRRDRRPFTQLSTLKCSQEVHVHIRKAAWRNVISALALVTFALPLATAPLAQSVSAQSVGNPNPLFNPPSIAGVGQLNPGPVAFNPIGTNHTVTFTCNNVITNGTFGAVLQSESPNGVCFGVTASVQNSTTGDASVFTAGTCSGATGYVNSAVINCQTPLFPASCGGISGIGASGTLNAALNACTYPITVAEEPACLNHGGTVTTTPSGTTANGVCTAGVDPDSQMSATINSGAPNVYTITVTGYVPAFYPIGTNIATCPAGTTGPTLVSLGFFGFPTGGTVLACQFSVSVQKKYVEITNVTLAGGPCGGQVTFSEGLKSFFGPSCTLTAVATGTTVIKTGVNCAVGAGEPQTGTAAPAEFGTGATYSCINGTLSVVGIPSTIFANGITLPFNFTSTGPGALNSGLPGVTLNGLCAGTTGASTATNVSSVTLCSTGLGSGTVQACYTGGSTVNTQPPVCSAFLNFTFTAPSASRVIPYVRWAGEKIVLTKCFGGAGFGANGLFAGALVKFSLQAADTTQAILIPAAFATGLASNLTGGTGGGTSTPVLAGSDTVYTTADNNGCATVIAYARSEGVVNVDAALYSTAISPTVGGVQLVNEHAFAVYFLKFDHLDLENITFSTYNTATALQPALTFTTAEPAPAGFPTSFPGSLAATFTLPNPPGTGQVAGGSYAIPICKIDYVRAMVHGYFEMPGDPSGRPASNVALTGSSSVNGTGTAAAGSFVLPAGRWVLPEDWPVLATFAGFSGGSPLNIGPSSLLAWDINSGWVFNPNGENAVLCFNPGNTNTIPTISTPPGAITPGNYQTGPCFGNDGATAAGATSYGGEPYSTAPAGICAGNNSTAPQPAGITIGPFDATQACTTNEDGTFGVALQPPGSTILTATSPTNFNLGPLSTNSSFLPNGTLNEWDAPMPPAQISFGITSGPGFLDQVNKTGLYALSLGATTSTTLVCPAAPSGSVQTASGTTCIYTFGQATTLTGCQAVLGSSAVASGLTCTVTGTFTSNTGTAVFPNPFYSTLIPASPLIPPILNNGGYLWDSFGFRGGTVAGFTTAPATIPGQSTLADAVLANTTPIGGAFPTVNAVTPGGVNLGPCTPSTSSATFTVPLANAAGFQPGMTVTAYSTTTPFNSVAINLLVTAVNTTTNMLTLQVQSGSGVVDNTFCSTALAGSLIFEAEQVGITVPATSVAALTANTSVALQQTNGVSVTGSVYANPSGGAAITSGSTVFLTNAQGLATALAGCLISRTTTGSMTPPVAALAVQSLNCEPGLDFLGSQTLVTTAPTISTVPVQSAAPIVSPYPFWQWVGGAATSSTAHPTTATVYSDNHGEAVVSLETGLTSGTLQMAPVNGVCPAGYYLVAATTTTAANCILSLAQLGLTTSPLFGTFQNVNKVTGGVAAPAASATGCFDTTATAGATAATGTAASVGANGPAAGQICVNGLGGVEFGAGAILGSTSLQAVADYPYTRGDHAPITSGSLTKIFTSGFVKSLSVTPGLAAPAGTGITNYTVTITASDVCGNPLVGEPVQVFALGNAGAVVLAPLGTGTSLGTGTANVVIGANGTATLSLEVLQSAIGNQGLVIKAVFPMEKVERIVVVVSGTAGLQTTVLYGPGYNQVGGPPGSNFSMAEALFSYNATTGTYANATAAAGNLSSAAPTCTGYWAYFAAATAVNLSPSSAVTSPATCTLAPGFNLVGNPFITPATIQSGFTAYHFNGTSYDVTQTIPVGGSVFIFNPSAASTTVTLTAT
jgi:hypothetical protein